MAAIRTLARTLAVSSMAVALLSGPAFAKPLSVMSYNVRGLPPQLIENRTAGIAAIAPLLEDFHTPAGPYVGMQSLVALQELFYQPYYDVLTDPQVVHYPHVTDKDASGPAAIGDGLTLLSDFEIGDLFRVPWDLCFGTLGYFGSDCDTPKGFTLSRVFVEETLWIDVYTLHADAGQDFGSRAARRDNILQLVETIHEESPEGTAVIVLGDTNSTYTRFGDDNIQVLLADAGLTDVWVELRRGGVVPGAGPDIEDDCETDPGSGDCELVDKIFYRSGDRIRLEASSYDVLHDMFSDGNGDDLSDHFPVVAGFEYTRIPRCGDATNDGEVTAADALKTLRVAVGSGTCPMEVCDYTGDGQVAASDALAMLRFAVGQPVAPLCPDATLAIPVGLP